MTFARRAITATITLGGGPNGTEVTGTYKLEGGRIACSIANYGGYSLGEMQCRLYGLTLDEIKNLTVTGTILNSRIQANEIRIEAGDENTDLSTVFLGGIYKAWADFRGSPDVSLNVIAYAGGALQLKPAPTYSTTGPVSAAQAFQGLANEGGLGFINGGVSAQLPIIHLTGSVIDQIRTLAQTVRCAHTISNNVLYIWPSNGSIPGNKITLSPGKGMVSYPAFSSSQITVSNEFLPLALLGNQVTIENDILGSMVNGDWNIMSVNHNIAAQLPDGPWFTTLGLFRPGQP